MQQSCHGWLHHNYLLRHPEIRGSQNEGRATDYQAK
jgi:hypothetical protein